MKQLYNKTVMTELEQFHFIFISFNVNLNYLN